MPVDVTCPTCNTITHLDNLERTSTSFCGTCDYPLFWANATTLAGSAAGGPDGMGLRRYPGTEGWAIFEKIDCPVCNERNLVTQFYCIRCGADLHPKQVVTDAATTKLPEIIPAAVPRRRRSWLAPLVIAAFAVECLAIWLVAAYVIY
ncbi:MAG TPA: hypothetical protein VME46_20015 [Acidimicrobiales bacterium]|nr:hypothetical protein [Acidimicrobiales bacterium]